MATKEEELHDELQLVERAFDHDMAHSSGVGESIDAQAETIVALLDIVIRLNSRIGALEDYVARLRAGDGL